VKMLNRKGTSKAATAKTNQRSYSVFILLPLQRHSEHFARVSVSPGGERPGARSLVIVYETDEAKSLRGMKCIAHWACQVTSWLSETGPWLRNRLMRNVVPTPGGPESIAFHGMRIAPVPKVRRWINPRYDCESGVPRPNLVRGAACANQYRGQPTRPARELKSL